MEAPSLSTTDCHVSPGPGQDRPEVQPEARKFAFKAEVLPHPNKINVPTLPKTHTEKLK